MNLFKSKIISALSSLFLILSVGTTVSAAELNLPGFSGTINTTVTSGVSMRVARDCLSVRGAKYLAYDSGGMSGGDYRRNVMANASIAAADKSVFLTDGEGCAKRYTDGYGNTGQTTSGARSLISANADNGRTNFDGGDIFDVTQRAYSEIIGTTDNGTTINLSFVGSYNPLIEVNGNPTFDPFDSKQQDEIETDLTLLNAYITQDINADHSLTIGRFVTSWGESTFIPIGMNGLTTNAVDLSKLRNPGASIKEALMPTEQITLQGFLNDGWSYEAYLQMNESHVALDEAGQFFGSEVASGDRLIITGQYSGNDMGRSNGCNYLLTAAIAVGGLNKACSSAADGSLAYYNSALGSTRGDMYYLDRGINSFATGTSATQTAFLMAKFGAAGTGASTTFGGTAGDIVTTGMVSPTILNAALTTGWDEYDRKGGIKAGAVDLAGGSHIFADGEDQFGLSLRKYVDAGNGIDLGFHFTQYDSKIPYLRMKGQGGIVAGDLLGAFSVAASTGNTLASMLSNGGALGNTGAVTLSSAQLAGKGMVGLGLANVAYGEAACSAYTKKQAANEVFGDGLTHVYTAEEITLAQQATLYTAINGKLYFDSAKCQAKAAAWGTGATQLAAAGLLGAAVTPLNLAEYEFIYPENLKAFGISANTNIGSTAVQVEVTLRPDFPLATDGADQGQQLSDAAGTTGLLTLGVAQGIYGADALAGNDAKKNATVAMYNAGNPGTTDWAGVLAAAKNFKRSYLPIITLDTVKAGDYYTTPYFEHDVMSGTIATTTAFTASHPVTTALGADSTILLTELGFVAVDGLSMAKPVARGGYRDGVGGIKCGGLTNGGVFGPTGFQAAGASVGATHLGSSQTDPLFGNGAYCESKNNADDFAMTYRLVGLASYNNIANTAWGLRNQVVWSHDFQGYSPSSLGGFVPGKQSLSLSSTLTKGSVKASLSYVNQLGDPMDNLGFDMDYVSGSLSYAF